MLESREDKFEKKISETTIKTQELLNKFSESYNKETESENKKKLFFTLKNHFRKILDKQFSDAINDEERQKIYHKLAIIVHPDKCKYDIPGDIKNRLFNILQFKHNDYSKKRSKWDHLNIFEVWGRLQNDEEFREECLEASPEDYDQILKNIGTVMNICIGETVVFAIFAALSLLIPVALLNALLKLNTYILNTLSPDTWEEIAKEYRENALLNQYNLEKNSFDKNLHEKEQGSEEQESNQSFQSFEDYKKNLVNLGFDLSPDLNFFNDIFTNFLKLFFKYLYKDLIENHTHKSSLKRLSLVPVYIALFVYESLIELVKLAIFIAIASLLLAWAAMTLITAFTTIGISMFWEKLFCASNNSKEDTYDFESENLSYGLSEEDELETNAIPQNTKESIGKSLSPAYGSIAEID